MHPPDDSDPLAAGSPFINATVMASAGTGKTWLLVTRLVRLLLDGARPDSILAITFTRKAAAEMQVRLMERLLDLAVADDRQLPERLAGIGADTDATTRQQARGLYEMLLDSSHPLRITTFHAFCQDVLRRFPLEAGIPPGFELIENSGLIEQEALAALWQDSTAAPDAPLSTALDRLLRQCGSVTALQRILRGFLAHRSDWWALTEGHGRPADHASRRLREQLGIDPDEDPSAQLFQGQTVAELAEFADLLGRHPTRQNLAHGELLERSLAQARHDPGAALALLRQVLFTTSGDRRRRKPSRAQENGMTAAGQQRFLELHDLLCDRLEETRQRLNAHTTWQLSTAWYLAGQQLLDHYQRIKEEQRLLDFNDLEWRTYQLLSHEQGRWVQYKLDQRINHILIDEFQDTNPTQWHMIRPLLEEMAQDPQQRSGQRSVFVVGDRKQSIYGFRRADPLLLDAARHWLETHMNGQSFALDRSRRSSPAIMALVNRVFSDAPLAEQIDAFTAHGTWQEHLHGLVEVLPLLDCDSAAEDADSPEAEAEELRNPLTTPRPAEENPAFLAEGRLIAARIHTLITAATAIEQHGSTRLLEYRDIMILVRRRTHIRHYEQALREARIPYISEGGSLLTDSLEIRDMVALLEILITPFNNLSLATVLRSPLFACSDRELLDLAALVSADDHWLDTLCREQGQLGPSLQRAARLLPRWQSLAGALPVHDLLDRIFNEGNVPARYEAAFAPHLHPRLHANLTRFIELALEVDSGRYPSLPHFLLRLESLQQHAPEALDEPSATDGHGGVRVMTIHAAKGLEAPVVFLADSGPQQPRARAWQPLTEWPADAARPTSFLLGGRREHLDDWSLAQHARLERENRREDANLLYVALTRARQMLFVTGSDIRKSAPPSWHAVISASLCGAEDFDEIAPGHYRHSYGQPGGVPTPAEMPQADRPEPAVDLAETLSKPLFQDGADILAATAPPPGSEEGRQRGTAVHRMLELLSQPTPPADETIRSAAAAAASLSTEDAELDDWLREARAVTTSPELRPLFDPRCFESAWNEVPLHYQVAQRPVHGVIDRLVVTADEVIVIDYKTHTETSPPALQRLAAQYREQLQAYRRGVERLWPGRRVRTLVLFTHCARSIELHGDDAGSGTAH